MALLTPFPKTSRRRLSQLGLLLAALLLSGSTASLAQTPPSRENQIKAVFLFNFAQFVEWPPQAFPETRTPLVIGVLGDDPFGAFLDETVRGEKVNNRPLVVRRYRRVEDIEICHILFISASETAQLDRVLQLLKGRNILTVGGSEGYVSRGVMVGFATEKSKIRLKINVEAAKAANLTISSNLLRPAEIVRSGK
jgi:hypothetical protein